MNSKLVSFAFVATIAFGCRAHACSSPALNHKILSITTGLVDMCTYEGKVLLIVNTASECGFTGQYEGLEALNKKYKAKGLEVLGFPSNDFFGQEPGANSEIAKFCKLNYGVTFDMFAKSHVTGDEINPLYKYLTKDSPQKGSVTWNFNKFLIDRKGNVVARFGSSTKPSDKDLIKAIESQL